MNSAILLALFASAAYANPAANPMAALLATATPAQVQLWLAACKDMVPLVPELKRKVDLLCETTCEEDTEVNCEANVCTVGMTIEAAEYKAARMNPPTTIIGWIEKAQSLPEGMRSCLTEEIYLAAAKDVERAFMEEATGLREAGDLSLPADSLAPEGRRCLLEFGEKMDAMCPALQAAVAAAAAAGAA